MSFTDLKSALNATDGNLSVHARKLEEAGYVSCEKTFSGRTPRTAYTLTAADAGHSKSTSTTWTPSFVLRAGSRTECLPPFTQQTG